jgi:hypothetical protein
MATIEDEMLAAKQGHIEDSPIVGVGIHDGGVMMINNQLRSYKAERWRYKDGKLGEKNGGLLKTADTTNICYRTELVDGKLLIHPERETYERVNQALYELQHGILPADCSKGLEIEGCLYDLQGNLLDVHDPITFPLNTNPHPELMSFTLETATSTLDSSEGKKHRQTTIEIAQGIAESVLTAHEIAERRGGKVIHTSVPEGGKPGAPITQHEYLLQAAPIVLEGTINHWDEVPQETLNIYRTFLEGRDPQQYLTSRGALDWPVHALHVHDGVLKTEGKADPRVAFAMGEVRLSRMAKLLSFGLYNTRHVYGHDVGTYDVRSIIRRMLHTTHGISNAQNATELLNYAVGELTEGKIHSLSRYPEKGQHGRVRYRMDGNYNTVESIDPPMSPDLRQVLAWTLANTVMDVMAFDALAATGGDESQVAWYLEQKYGSVLQKIPEMGDDSSFEMDLEFNTKGYNGGQKEYTFRDQLKAIYSVVQQLGEKYPAIKTHSDIVCGNILSQITPEQADTSLEEYLGIENGIYQANGKNNGSITHYKNRSIQELIDIQAEATRMQAEALKNVKIDEDLYTFFGLIRSV